MTNVIKKIKQTGQKIRDFFPSDLPRGMTKFDEFAKSLISTYDLPDNDSTVFAFAAMISQLSPTTVSKSRRYFANSARKSMANQIAFAIMQTLKDKQKAEIQAAAEKAKQVEATTAAESVASDVQSV